MTALALDLVRKLQATDPADAWRKLFAFVWQTWSGPVSGTGIAGETLRRDRAVGPADLFLATAGWDLWSNYYDSVPRTADRLAAWWSATPPGRAALILDALSIREAMWLVCGAAERGYTVHCAEATGAELPADTNSFARAMGFGHRSALENDGAGSAHRLPGARTDSVDLPWQECADLLDAAPDWVLWHHWPDDRIHDLSAPGRGLSGLAREIASQLSRRSFLGADRTADDRPEARHHRGSRVRRHRAVSRRHRQPADELSEGTLQERPVRGGRLFAGKLGAAHRHHAGDAPWSVCVRTRAAQVEEPGRVSDARSRRTVAARSRGTVHRAVEAVRELTCQRKAKRGRPIESPKRSRRR